MASMEDQAGGTPGPDTGGRLVEVAPGVWRLRDGLTPAPCPGPCDLCAARGRQPR